MDAPLKILGANYTTPDGLIKPLYLCDIDEVVKNLPELETIKKKSVLYKIVRQVQFIDAKSRLENAQVKITELEEENAHLQKTISLQEKAKPKATTKPKAKPKEKSGTTPPRVVGVVPKPAECEVSDGGRFNYYENTTIYLDKDTYRTETHDTYDSLYNSMKKHNSCACMKFGEIGDKGNTYIIKSPIGSEHMILPKEKGTQKYPKGGGGDYESIIKNLKSNKSAMNKKAKTFVFKWD